MMKGKLIVFEGVDGAGTETQSKLLLRYLNENDRDATRIGYPDYEGDLGKLIRQFLDKKKDLSAEMQFLLYAGDMVKDREKINALLNQGKMVIADRYFNSTIVYQGLRGFRLENALKFSEDFGIPEPDVVIFLKISPDESAKRKLGENGKLDRHEEDKLFLERVNKSYEKMAIDNVFGRWFIIDGEKPKQEVFKGVISILRGMGIIKSIF
jgi:dTMP kinase